MLPLPLQKRKRGMQTKNTFYAIMATILILGGCSKDKALAPLKTSNCVLQSEATTLIGNDATWTYEYDQDGNPKVITKMNRYGGVENKVEIVFDGTIITRSNAILKTGYDAAIMLALPTKADVSITMGGVEQRNYWSYFFFYDAKGRLVKVGEQTNNVTNDHEYDLTITYDDNDNVTQLFYERTTGPRDPIPTVKVSGYDDKPSPYTGVKSYKFLMNNYNWDNYDPGYILQALSANNPLDYTVGDFTRTMSYKYNEHGFPTECLNTNQNANGTATFLQTFSYLCK
jgi:hypothetical protein